MRVLLLVLTFLLLTATAAVATEYMPGATYGQVSPDRVLLERENAGLVLSAAAVYSPEGRYGFYQVTEQCCPERVLAIRQKTADSSGMYMAYSPTERYPVWGCCGQVSPDRVLCERCGTL